MKDSLGVEIRPDDQLMVTSYGDGARLVDCHTTSRVIRFGRTRVVIYDADMRERSVSPTNLQVLRRDGKIGFEGNRKPEPRRVASESVVISIRVHEFGREAALERRDEIVDTLAEIGVTLDMLSNGDAFMSDFPNEMPKEA